MSKRVTSAFALTGLLALLLTACVPTATGEAPPSPGGLTQPAIAPTAIEQPTPTEEGPVVLRVGGLMDNDCWNPYSCSNFYYFESQVIEGLTGLGPNSQGCPGVPLLAESWEVSEDGLTWTIRLHRGITYSDGKPFTAGTLQAFLDWIRSSETLAPFFPETLNMESTEVVDELTLKYTTTHPILSSPDFNWIWMYVMPPHIWSQLGEDEILTFENFPPVGTGPYVITEYEPGSHIVYDARPDYHLGKPPIDRVVYTIYANQDALVSALLGGEIDLTFPWMPPESYEALASAPNVVVEEKPPYAGQLHWLVFNMSAGGKKHPAIDDPVVREAVDYAIDKQKLVDVALLGHGVTCPTSWTCGSTAEGSVNPDLVVTPYDPDKARKMLEEAGYRDSDGDGIRETANGVPLKFRLLYEIEAAPTLSMTELISDQLGEVGIKAEPEANELGTYLALVLDQRDFDMALESTTHDIDAASLDFWFSCWSADAGASAFNYPGYCNPEVDDLVAGYWYAPDLESRWEPMYQAQAILSRERPIITLAGQNSIQAYRSDRFEFPKDTCDALMGMFSEQGLMNATVK